MRTLMKALLAGTLFLTAPVFAEEGPTSGVRPLNGGIICDDLDQVRTLLETRTRVEGCGQLRTSRGVPGTVTLLGEFEANGHIFMLARYNFVVPTPWNQVQYGWWGRPVPVEAEAEPSAHEIDA